MCDGYNNTVKQCECEIVNICVRCTFDGGYHLVTINTHSFSMFSFAIAKNYCVPVKNV